MILIADVSRAFFEAPMHRNVAVELPDEALTKEEKDRDLVGILDMSLYGTRDAAINFQKEVGKLMKSLGYSTSKYNPSLFHHRKGWHKGARPRRRFRGIRRKEQDIAF